MNTNSIRTKAVFRFILSMLLLASFGLSPGLVFGQQQKWPQPDRDQQNKIRNAKNKLLKNYLKQGFWKHERHDQQYLTDPLDTLAQYTPFDGTGFAAAYEAMMDFEFAKREYLPDEFSTKECRKYLYQFLQIEPASEKALLMSAELAIIDGDKELVRTELKTMIAASPFSLSELIKKDVFDAAESKEISKAAVAKIGRVLDRRPALTVKQAKLAVREITAMVEDKTDVRAEMVLMQKLKRNQRLRDSHKILAAGFAVVNRKHDAFLIAKAEKEGGCVLDSLSGTISPTVETYLTKLGLGDGEQSKKAKAMFDPFKKVRGRSLFGNDCKFAWQTSLLLADDAASRNHFRWEYTHRLTALRNAKDMDERAEVLKTMINRPEFDPWETLSVMDPIDPWRRKRSIEQTETILVLRGKILAKMGLMGRAAECFKSAIAKHQASPRSDSSQHDEAKRLLKDCYKRLLADCPAPKEVIPQKRTYVRQLLPTIAGPVNISFYKPPTSQTIEEGEFNRAIKKIVGRRLNKKTRVYLDAYEKIQELGPLEKPGYAKAHLHFADSESYAKDRPVNYQHIIQHTTHAISLDKNMVTAYITRGKIFKKLGRTEDELANYHELYEAKPTEFYRLYSLRNELQDNHENQELVRDALARITLLAPQEVVKKDNSYFPISHSIGKLVSCSDDPNAVLELVELMLDCEGGNSYRMRSSMLACYSRCLSKHIELEASKGKADVATRLKVHRKAMDISSHNPEAKLALAAIALENEAFAKDAKEIYDTDIQRVMPTSVVILVLKNAIARGDEAEVLRRIHEFSLNNYKEDKLQSFVELGELLTEVENHGERGSLLPQKFASRAEYTMQPPLSYVVQRRLQRVAGLLAFANQDYASAVKHLLPLREHFADDNRLRAALEESRMKTEDQ